MKIIIKKIIKQIAKVLIAIFDSNKKYSFDVNKAKQELNSLYEYKEYDLTSCVKNITTYKYDLSLIVPIYNASNYLKKCIDSLLAQKTNYKYEIICIDDGSTDNSLEILNSYKSDILKIFHQNNEGISSARNKGLCYSTGRYIGFVDNDDYVNNNYVEELLKTANENDADYVKCSFYVVNNNSKSVIDNTIYEDVSIFNISDENTNISHHLLTGYMWGGCYKREIWDEFCFPLGYWFEDMIKSIYLYNIINTISCVSDILYVKRKHNNNASNSLWKKSDIKSLDQLYLVEAIEKIKNDRKIENKKIVYECMLYELGEYLYKRINKLPNKIKKDAFIVSSSIIRSNKNYQYNKKDNYKEYYLQKSLVNGNYTLWKLISLYCW